MPGFTLRPRLENGEKIFAAWMSSGHPRLAEAVVSVGFDAVVFDLQHGEATLAEVRDAVALARLAGKAAGIRAGLEAYGEAARMLDLGAEIAIMPMVDSAEAARRLVETLKYPPLGRRSWGPTRATDLLRLSAETYRNGANEGTLALAMIETRAAVDAMEEILDVPGLDGVFVGPSDLSISLSAGRALDHRMPEAVAAMESLLALAKSRNKITAIFCNGGEAAARNAAMGFDILGIGSDLGFLTEGARSALKAARGTAKQGGARY
jgi:4-hydroxy-2-oxoheptanedioate aldolase